MNEPDKRPPKLLRCLTCESGKLTRRWSVGVNFIIFIFSSSHFDCFLSFITAFVASRPKRDKTHMPKLAQKRRRIRCVDIGSAIHIEPRQKTMQRSASTPEAKFSNAGANHTRCQHEPKNTTIRNTVMLCWHECTGTKDQGSYWCYCSFKANSETRKQPSPQTHNRTLREQTSKQIPHENFQQQQLVSALACTRRIN